MSRSENSKVIAPLFVEFFEKRFGHEPHSYMSGCMFYYQSSDQETLMAFVLWLRDEHPEAYSLLCSYYVDGVPSDKPEDKVFPDYGSHGYLPHFSDEPDYWYVYC